ncbi:MAG: ATP-dependent DNA helicase [Planctomycetota bacterium]|nr:ATP-dependent DNA helicase [Planctomycetota bacterium]
MTTMRQLNEAQKQAVTHDCRTGGPLIILAGPGTGKTHVITHRVAHIIDEQGVDPASILAITYTRKAAGELRERINGIIGPDRGARVNAYTFNGFGQRLMQRFATYLGLPGNLSMIDQVQSRRLIQSIVLEHDLLKEQRGRGVKELSGELARQLDAFASHGYSPDDCAKAAARWKARLERTTGLDPEAMLAEQTKQQEFAQQAVVYKHFLAERYRRGWVSYADQVLLPIKLLREHAGPAAIVRSEIRCVIVDEFQDSNRGQIELLRALIGPETYGGRPDLTIVGDDDQSIYGFRGADMYNFKRFRDVWARCKPRVVALEENHRSQPEIIAVSNQVIGESGSRFEPNKLIRFPQAKKPEGGRVELVYQQNEKDDAESISAMLLADRAAAADPAAFTWNQYAVIARTHGDLDRIQAAMRLYDIPFDRVREKEILADEGVGCVMAWAEWILKPSATWAAQVVMRHAPYSLPSVAIIDWVKEYQAGVERHKEEFEDAPAMPPFHEWLATKVDLTKEPMVGLLLEMYRKLSAMVGSMRGDDAIFAIVRETGAGLMELLPTKERHRRVSALLTLVSFVREKQPRIDRPGSLRDLWDYINEFDDWRKEEPSSQVDASEDELEGDESADRPQGRVLLLTAHASKGLQFPVVILPRVASPHGYPKTGGANNMWFPPADLLDLPEGEAAPDEKQVRLDEERRIFYVACTRAQSRLVLLGKKLGAKSSAQSYTRSLAAAKPALVLEVDGLALFARAFELGVGGSDWTPAGPGERGTTEGDEAQEAARTHVERVRTAARLAAAGALERTQDAAMTVDGLGDLERVLSESLHTLAAMNIAVRTRALPKWKLPDAARKAAGTYLSLLGREPEAADTDRSFPIVTPKGPLDLSFTSIYSYDKCPRCYYLHYYLGLPDRDSDSANTGVAVHRVLEEFFSRWRDAEAEGKPLPTLEELAEMTKRNYEATLPPLAKPDPLLLDQLLSQTRLAASTLHTQSDQILEMEQTIRFPYVVDEMTHTFIAKIDRIDQMADGGLRVIDYKTGRASKDKLDPKSDDLQLGIYLMALKSRFGAEVSGQGEYWMLATGQRGVLPFADIKENKVRDSIDSAIRGILAGEFEPGAKCGGDCRLLG